MTDLKRVEIMALTLLRANGYDQVGVIDDENKLAAALVYENLEEKGFVMSILKQDGKGPMYYITAKGQRALDSSR